VAGASPPAAGAIDPVADPTVFRAWFDMDITRFVLDSLTEYQVYKANDGGKPTSLLQGSDLIPIGPKFRNDLDHRIVIEVFCRFPDDLLHRVIGCILFVLLGDRLHDFSARSQDRSDSIAAIERDVSDTFIIQGVCHGHGQVAVLKFNRNHLVFAGQMFRDEQNDLRVYGCSFQLDDLVTQLKCKGLCKLILCDKI
jgi:hypothetical protein